MKNKKLIKIVAATVMCSAMALSVFSFTACNEGESGGANHTHTYSTGNEWGHNGTHHWRYATCEHSDLFSDKRKHTFVDGECSVCHAAEQIIKPVLTEADDNDPTPDQDGKIDVTYEINPSKLEAGAINSDLTQNIFTVSSGVTVRERARKYQEELTFANSLNIGSSSFKINAPDAGTLTIYIASGSGTATAGCLLDGQAVSYPDASNAVVNKLELPLTKGLHVITKNSNLNSTNDIYYAVFTTKAVPTDVEKIEVENGGKVDYFLGDDFSEADLTVNAIYKTTGVIKSVPVGRLTVDYSNFDSSKSGEYQINVKYEKGGKTYDCAYPVTVYEMNSIELSTYTTNSNKQTTLKTVYLKGETFNTTGLSVTANTKCGEKEAAFRLKTGQYTLNTPDLSTTGEKTVTVTTTDSKHATAEFKVYVVEKAEAVSNKISVTVDKSQPVSSTNFQTITQALDYLGNYEAAVEKVVNITDGEYNEKVWVNLPNVTFIGSATNTPDATTNNGAVICYDAISGKTDAAGTPYGTKGSGTVTVTSAATNFVAKNITFKNKYNTKALYDESLKISSNSQACALVVESPSASFFNCKMTSYHDTLYSNTGSHYYKNCWIEGHTDFIFGADAVSYFDHCTIYSIGSGANDENGGYICAYQNTSTAYGPIFNGCTLTSDDNVKDGSIALGRAWGKEFKMVVINSSLTVKYSTTPHTATTDKGQRYVTMSGNDPKPENMLEYNNTGDGAISASIPNTCTYMTSDAASAYELDKLATLLGFTPVE